MPFVESRIIPPFANADREANHDVFMPSVQSGEVDGIGVIVFLDEAADTLELLSAAVAVDV